MRYLYLVLERQNIGLGAYIRRRRLDCAAALLRHPGRRDMTIAAVAHACGFYDHAHFSRAFRAATGMTPSQWRRAGELEVGLAPTTAVGMRYSATATG